MNKRATELLADLRARYSEAAIRSGFRLRDKTLCAELRELALELNPRLGNAPPWVCEWKGYEELLGIEKSEDTSLSRSSATRR